MVIHVYFRKAFKNQRIEKEKGSMHFSLTRSRKKTEILFMIIVIMQLQVKRFLF